MEPQASEKTSIALRCLRHILPQYDRDNLYHNFERLFESELQAHGPRWARIWLWGQIFKSVPGLISAYLYWRYTWFKNYLKTARRNLVRHKLFLTLNVTGLALGLTCFIGCSLYILQEFSYDRFHRHAKNIYRVVKKSNLENGVIRNSANVPGLFAPALKSEYPDLVQAVVRCWHYWGLGFDVQYQEKVFKEVNFAFVEATIFNIFDFEFLAGDPKTALNAPYRTVITAAAAAKYFGRENPLGKSLRINGEYEVQVTGVIQDLPRQSHFHFDFLTAFTTLERLPWNQALNNWRDDFCYTYLLLKPGVAIESLSQRLPALCQKYLPVAWKTDSFWLQPLTAIHLNSNLDDEIEPDNRNRRSQIFILISMAIFILAMAIINYVNLTTAGYSLRIKEIGVRKILGSQRRQLIFQFMSDSILIGLIALLLSLLMLGLLQSYFSSFLGEKLAFSRITSRPFILFLVGLGFAVGVIAGIYPAFYLAAFRPMVILSHLFRTHPQQGLGRKILVVVQITIAVSLIIGSQIIHQQLDYMHQYAVQFDREQLLVLSVNATPIAHTHYDAFVKQITAQPAIISATGLRNVVGIGHIKEPFSIKGNPASQQMLPFYLVRHHFVETFGLQVIVGRDFSNQFPTDETEAILINQTLAQQFGWRPADAIGKMLTHPGWGDLKVIGVIHDFNFESLHRAIKPLVIKLIWPARQAALTDYLAVRVNPRQLENTIQMMRHTWKQYAPQAAFDYYFLDQKLRQFYHHEATLSQVSSRFTLLALILACFGLLGLISFSTERKTKEIALRKVLGASVLKIVGWMAREFALLVLIANCIAGPLAYLAGKLWLQNFAYRIQISPWIFVLGAGITFFTSMAAILFHTLKAAYTNPVDFLRSE